MRNKILIFIGLFLCLSAEGQNIVPKPNKLERGEGYFTLTQYTVISDGGFTELALYLNSHISQGCKYNLGVNSENTTDNTIAFVKDVSLSKEEYKLNVSPSRIELSASSPSGMYYALQTLLQLMPAEMYGTQERTFNTVSIPCVNIIDAPRYKYRGLMMDVSRTFFDKRTVMRHIDWMSRHKLNKLHWHLSDDNGWRIEIKSHPELTSRGAWRGPDEVLPASYGSGDRRYGGYYTQDDVKEIVEYARFRNVEIIPEIDLPGHSQVMTHVYPETHCDGYIAEPSVTAAVKNVICVAREENYQMLDDILSELAVLFPSKYIHIGGDEVSTAHWRACSRCQELMRKRGLKSSQLLGYFINRVEKIAASKGKECGVWNDVLKNGTVSSSTLIYGWENAKACTDATTKGYQTVFMPAQYWYIDMKQGLGERGHSWAGMVTLKRVYSLEPNELVATEAQRNKIAGVEGAMFAELLGEPQHYIEYQLYPRLCALAEAGWTKPEQKNYDDFYNRLLGSHFKRLAYMGIMFRVPPPDITFSAEQGLVATGEIEGTDIYYTTNSNSSMDNAVRYTVPIQTDTPWNYNFRAYYHRGVSPVVKYAKTKKLTLRAGEKQVVSFPLSEYAPFEGIWMISVTPDQDNTMINRLEVTGSDTTYTIIRTGQSVNPLSTLRLYMNDKNSTATAYFTITNNNSVDNNIVITFRPSPYIEPKVSVTTSLPINSRFALSNIADYHRTSYTRSSKPCDKGDYVTYTFSEPLECSSIELLTGIPDVIRYIITDGTVMVSLDGHAYKTYGNLDHNGSIVITNERKIKSIRININGSNGEPIVAFQDLRIIK